MYIFYATVTAFRQTKLYNFIKFRDLYLQQCYLHKYNISTIYYSVQQLYQASTIITWLHEYYIPRWNSVYK
jgi:hypothetical protein